MSITPRQVALAQNSWLEIATDEERAASLFYQNLFEAYPEVRGLFSSNMSSQRLKFMAILTTVVDSLGDLEAIRGDIEAMGVRHRGYGTETEHYAAVAEVLLQTFEEILGPKKFTKELRETWVVIYGRLAEMMIAAAADA